MKKFLLIAALFAGSSVALQAQTTEAKVDAPKKSSCCASKAEKAKCAEMKTAEANEASKAEAQAAAAGTSEASAAAKPSCCASKAVATDGSQPCSSKVMAEKQRKEEALTP